MYISTYNVMSLSIMQLILFVCYIIIYYIINYNITDIIIAALFHFLDLRQLLHYGVYNIEI